METGHTHTQSHTRICLELDHWEIKMVAQSNRILLAIYGLILDVFTVQVCVSRRARACAGQCTGAPRTHRLITMTTSAGVGEIFTTLVWHWASCAEEQLLAYQIILQLGSVCVFKAVSSVNVFWLSGDKKNKPS